MEAAAKNSEKKIRAAGKIWRDDETRKLLELMKGGEEGLGFYGRMKVKKLERNRAMSAIAANLSADNIAVTSQQVNNNWKSLLARYRVVEDHNRQSGVPESVPVTSRCRTQHYASRHANAERTYVPPRELYAMMVLYDSLMPPWLFAFL